MTTPRTIAVALAGTVGFVVGFYIGFALVLSTYGFAGDIETPFVLITGSLAGLASAVAVAAASGSFQRTVGPVLLVGLGLSAAGLVLLLVIRSDAAYFIPVGLVVVAGETLAARSSV